MQHVQELCQGWFTPQGWCDEQSRCRSLLSSMEMEGNIYEQPRGRQELCCTRQEWAVIWSARDVQELLITAVFKCQSYWRSRRAGGEVGDLTLLSSVPRVVWPCRSRKARQNLSQAKTQAGLCTFLYQPNVQAIVAAELCRNWELSGNDKSSLFSISFCLMMAKCFINANKKFPEDSCSFLLYRWWWSRNRWCDLPETTCKEQPLSWELTMELLPHVGWAGEGSSGIKREQDIPRGRKSLRNILASNEVAHLRVLHFRWDRWRTQNLRYSKLIWGISNQFPLKLMETLMQSTLRSSSRFFPSKIFPLTWKQVVPNPLTSLGTGLSETGKVRLQTH